MSWAAVGSGRQQGLDFAEGEEGLCVKNV
jgi:hypothetical protein